MSSPRPVILILGPTAGGKTELAIELALRLDHRGECICADSMQVYRGMDIGTAKPTPQQQKLVPHHLLDIADPSGDGFSVDTWLNLAEQTIAEVRARGRCPIVVGGTNLYVQAFLEGLFEGPEPDAQLRERLRALDLDELREWLLRIDAEAAQRIHRRDRKRTIRAIEVHELTGRPISEHQQQWHAGRVRRDVRIIGLEWPVEAINRRINARVKAMMEQGLLEEVRELRARGGLGRQASEALGYKQIIEHLEGRSTLEEAVEQIRVRTRRFAKQQRTWLRRFRIGSDSLWLDASRLSAQSLVDKALTFIQMPLSTPRK